MYGNGAVMGFTPQQVDQMSLWQFTACVDGYNRSQGAEEKLEAPSSSEFYDMVERMA